MEYQEFYVTSNPPLLPSGVAEVIQRAKKEFGSQLLEILYDPEVPWFKCITSSDDRNKVSVYIEELLEEMVDADLESLELHDGPPLRNESGALVDVFVAADEPVVVPWVTYVDFQTTQHSDYDAFQYPAALSDYPHKAVWRPFEEVSESDASSNLTKFMATLEQLCGSFMVPAEIDHSGSFLGCDRIARNLTGTLIFVGGSTQESVHGALRRLDNIFAEAQHVPKSSESKHMIAAAADGASCGVGHRWLTHLALAKRTFVSDDVHGLLLTPCQELRNDPSEGACLRIAKRKDGHAWEVDPTTYADIRAPGSNQASQLGPFDGFKYPEKLSSLPRSRSSQSQASPSRPQTGPRDSRSRTAPSYASAAGGVGRGRPLTRPTTPAMRGTSTATSGAKRVASRAPSAAPSVAPSVAPSMAPSAAPSVALSAAPPAAPSVAPSAVPSVAPSASSASRPPTLIESVLASRPRDLRNQQHDQNSDSKERLQAWISEIRPPVEDLMSFDEPVVVEPPRPSRPAPDPATGVTSPITASAIDAAFGGAVTATDPEAIGDAPTSSPAANSVSGPVRSVQGGTAFDPDEDLIDFGLQENPIKELHSTMNQKAGRRSQSKSQQRPQQSQSQSQNRVVPGAPPRANDDLGASLSTPSPLLKPEILKVMEASVQSLAQRLQMVSGEVGLELRFGRLYVKRPSQATVSTTKSVSSDLIWNLDAASQELRKIPSDSFAFQPILSAKGSDANLLAQLREPGEPRWNSPARTAVYRFICYHMSTKTSFMVDIDVGSPTFLCRGLVNEIASQYIHCPEHAWGMKACATRSRIDFPEEFRKFAEYLYKSLEVTTDPNGVTSIRAAGNPVRGFEIRGACIVHQAKYLSRSQDGRLLVIKMTRPIFKVSTSQDLGIFHGTVGVPPDKEGVAGYLSQWFEASIRSTKADRAFQSNKSLQTGEKAGWTGEELGGAGAFTAMCRSALSLLPKMDGIGWANENGHSASMAKDGQGDGDGRQFLVYDQGFW